MTITPQHTDTIAPFNFHLEEVPFYKPLDLADNSPFSESPLYVPGACALSGHGVDGVQRDYSLAADDIVVSLILLCMMLAVVLVSNSWRYLSTAAAEFFYPHEHNNIYDIQTSDSSLHGGLSLLLLAGLSQGLLLYMLLGDELSDYMLQVGLPSEYDCRSAAAALCLGVSLAGWVLQIAAYAVADSIFFTPRQRQVWREGVRLMALLQSLLMLLLVCAGVFMAVSSRYVLICSLLAIGVVKTLLLIKAKRTFFDTWAGLLHIILYFCTLEIAPIVILISILT